MRPKKIDMFAIQHEREDRYLVTFRGVAIAALRKWEDGKWEFVATKTRWASTELQNLMSKGFPTPLALFECEPFCGSRTAITKALRGTIFARN